MKDSEILENLVELAEKLRLKVIFDNFEGKGGFCKVRGKEKIILNDSLPKREKIKILAQELSKYSLENIYLLPKIREIIEAAKANTTNTTKSQ
ncbi:MAG: hypothetical protein AB1393_08540 [Candidatus Edwardsbacteria bacterium]